MLTKLPLLLGRKHTGPSAIIGREFNVEQSAFRGRISREWILSSPSHVAQAR